MTGIEIHQRENSDETEKHLQDNIGKFQSDCRIVLRELYKGRKLTALILAEEYGIADWGRRLRDCYASRKDIRREWVYDAAGKRTKYKQYYMDIPKPPTKKEVYQQAQLFLNNQK